MKNVELFWINDFRIDQNIKRTKKLKEKKSWKGLYLFNMLKIIHQPRKHTKKK